VVVFGLGGIGLNVIQGARMVGADMIIGVDINPAREALAEKFGMTHFVNPKEVEGDLVDTSSADRGRRRLQLRVRRQRQGHAPGAGVLPQGLGRAASSSAWPARAQEISDAAVPARHRPRGKGSAFGGARGRTDVPKIVDWYMDGKINIDDLITHK
jgi:S-(hydroxymethyl)glutathione dehydrogenase/alcohol dehydrogenase